jgi:hypothetical protein
MLDVLIQHSGHSNVELSVSPEQWAALVEWLQVLTESLDLHSDGFSVYVRDSGLTVWSELEL